MDDRFLTRPGTVVKPRRPRIGQKPRNIDRVSEDEISAGLLLVVAAIHGGKRAEIVRQAAREFGYKKTSDQIEKRIGQMLDRMVDDGRLHYLNDTVVSDSIA